MFFTPSASGPLPPAEGHPPSHPFVVVSPSSHTTHPYGSAPYSSSQAPLTTPHPIVSRQAVDLSGTRPLRLGRSNSSPLVTIPVILVMQPASDSTNADLVSPGTSLVASPQEVYSSPSLEGTESVPTSMAPSVDYRRISTCTFTPGTSRQNSIAVDQFYSPTVSTTSLPAYTSAPPLVSVETSPVIRVVSPPPTPPSGARRKSGPTSKKLNTQRFRSQLCRNFLRSGRCAFGDRCAFAHGLTEIRDPKPTAGPLESPSESASSPSPTTTPASPKPGRSKAAGKSAAPLEKREKKTIVPAPGAPETPFVPLQDFVLPSPIRMAQMELVKLSLEAAESGDLIPSPLDPADPEDFPGLPVQERPSATDVPKAVDNEAVATTSAIADPDPVVDSSYAELEAQLKNVTADPQLVAYTLRYLALQQQQ